MTRTLIAEAVTGSVAGATTERGTIPVEIITPGWGSSGYYSARVLENAATATVFAKGTHMYLDHPTETDRYDRPERSVRDLVAVLAEDATWDGSALVAEAKVFGPYRDMFRDEDFVEAIGVSIRGAADTTIGEAEGRQGQIITDLTEAKSVDFVTKAGRGGRVTAVLESHRAAIEEASVDDMRDQLQQAVKSAYGTGEKTWSWLRDFDPDAAVAWFTVETDGESRLWQQSYIRDETGVLSLSGDRVEVRVVTKYVPVRPLLLAEGETPNDVPAPAGQSHPIQESTKEDTTMPEISEARLAELTEAAGRVTALETERDTATRERDEAVEALAARDRSDHINRVIDAVEGADTLTRLERAGLVATVPAGDVDENALTAAVTAAVQESAQRAGTGRVRGLGSTTSDAGTGEVTEADIDALTADAFGRQVKEA